MGRLSFSEAEMPNLAKILQNYQAGIGKDQRLEKLHRALERFSFDGTELHCTINAELRGPENEIAASNIRHAVLSQYRDTIPRDAVIEVVDKFLEDEALA
jgi:hypothetical protein